MQVAPFGSWKSPLTADAIVAGSIGLNSIVIDGTDIYWLESRPQEAGRNVIVRRSADGKTCDVTPQGYNVRSRVHEYGGAAYTVADGCVYFSNYSDNCLYAQDLNAADPQFVRQLTRSSKHRYADLMFDPHHHRLICVCEERDVAGLEPLNTIVSVGLTSPEDIYVLAGGCDFYAAPRLSADGSKLAWLSWNHPNMPWDGTNLQVAAMVNGYLSAPTLIAGGAQEAIFQPQWADEDTLYFVSDRTGWGNLYRWCETEGAVAICPLDAEFSLPQWVFGMSTYAILHGGGGTDVGQRIVCTYTQNGIWHLGLINTRSGHFTRLHTPYTDISGIRAVGNTLFCCVASPTQPTEIVAIDLLNETRRILQRSSQLPINTDYISRPEAIEFPTANEQLAYAFYYPPTNQDYQAPPGEKPPLLVKSHGGPTAATSNSFNPKIQYWTSRGFAVVDVNYGGSTGYGKEYRQRLDGNWGIVDVEDCVNAAKYLVDRGSVDGDRLAISGSSAGGYTTLAALTFRDTFKAGASYYGISDLASLAKETHKFEARYTDRLVAPYPMQASTYQNRSPLYFTHQLSCPIAFFQGLEDKVVLPNQAQMMVDALKERGIPVAHVTFPTEGHGFRDAANIKRALSGEFYFYARIFGFQPAETIEPIEIIGLGNRE